MKKVVLLKYTVEYAKNLIESIKHLKAHANLKFDEFDRHVAITAKYYILGNGYYKKSIKDCCDLIYFLIDWSNHIDSVRHNSYKRRAFRREFLENLRINGYAEEFSINLYNAVDRGELKLYL